MHSSELASCIRRVLGKLNSQDSHIAVLLLFCGVWHSEIEQLKVENLDGRVLTITGKKAREVVLDETTCNLIKWASKQKKKRKGRIVDLSGSRLSTILAETCRRSNFNVTQPSTEFRNFFIKLSIEKGRNAVSVMKQAGRKPDVKADVPSIDDRIKDFDSKPII